jgi:hypothetical protein
VIESFIIHKDFGDISRNRTLVRPDVLLLLQVKVIAATGDAPDAQVDSRPTRFSFDFSFSRLAYAAQPQMHTCCVTSRQTLCSTRAPDGNI